MTAHQKLMSLLLPVLLFAVLYARSLDYAFVWTDQGEIESGLILLPADEIASAFGRSLFGNTKSNDRGLEAPYYRPLQVVAVSLVDHNLGREPRYFRAINLTLGVATVALLSILVFRLVGSVWAGVAAGALFAGHPANIENYVWIAGLSHALVAFFIVICLGATLTALRETRRKKVWLAGAGSLVALGAALLSKENAAVAPAFTLALAISLVAENQRRSDAARSLARRAAFLVLAQSILVAAVFLGVRPLVLGASLAATPLLQDSVAIHWMTSIASWPDSLRWIAAPLESSTSDVVRLVVSPMNGELIAGVALAGISLALWVRLLRTGQAMAALGLAWLWIGFLPTSGLIPLNHMRGERYLALALIGLCVLIPSAAEGYARSASGWRRAACVGAVAGLILVFGQRTWQRVPEWRSQASLFESDVASNPLYREGYLELAKAHVRAGDLTAAARTLEDLEQLAKRFSGHASFFRMSDFVALSCQVDVERGHPLESLRRIGSLTADSPELGAYPQIALCAGRVLRAAARHDQARSVLGVLYEQGRAPTDGQAALELAGLEIDAGRPLEAARWLDVPALTQSAFLQLTQERERLRAKLSPQRR